MTDPTLKPVSATRHTNPKDTLYCDPVSRYAIKAFTMKGHMLTRNERLAQILWVRRGYSLRYPHLHPYQLINHFPNHYAIINKSGLTATLRNVTGENRLPGCADPKSFYSEAYCLNEAEDRQTFLDLIIKSNKTDTIWIYKPGGSSKGRGVRVLNNREDIINKVHKSSLSNNLQLVDGSIFQRYITNPLLLDGRKSELRIYWLIASLNPLQVFMFPEPTVRLNAMPFQLGELDNKLIHITNTYQQKRHPDFKKDTVLKWTFAKLGRYLHEELKIADADFLYKILIPRIGEILKTVSISSREQLLQRYPGQGDCFALYGADIIMDDKLNPWLTEIQKGPGLSLDDPVKVRIIPPMLAEAANIMFEIRRKRIARESLSNLESVQNFIPIVDEAAQR